jgi:soluble cytochrome b562
MAGALGGALGLLLNIGSGYEKARLQKKQQADQAFVDLAVKNPAVFASDPKLLKEVGKRTSPEFADLLGGMGKQQQAFQSQLSGVIGGGAPTAGGASPSPRGGGPSPASQMIASAAGGSAPAAGAGAQGGAAGAADPMTAHIQMLDGKIQQLEQLLVSPAASDPANAGAVEHLKTLVSDLRQQRTQLTSEQYQTEKQSKSEEFQSQQTDKREAAAEARMERSQAAAEGRMEATTGRMFRLESMREDFRDHLERMKDAQTAAQKRRAFTTTIAGLTKTRSSIEARANKAPDQATRQAEVDTFNSGLDTLKVGLDDPDQIKQLDDLRLNVGEAKPGRIYGETPGMVGPENGGGGGPTLAPGERLVRDKSGKAIGKTKDGKTMEPL